ncbi:ImmA/IrrE family metallo-endopeptidase [Paenibacillus alba]|uniref:helix-turn-helix domain-containing protein n=1 Tax=Paenibacillus alba TaxID=1197127 RepID=UPI0015635926|nr:XRE family transcriptional regulator [Paenibacillus alba]NQX71810.1 ImmA/IrrE family metallo-endopeptidase [Paenibacillus alba]
MSIDVKLLANRLKKYRIQFERSIQELSRMTGLPISRLESFELGEMLPSGDELLILADSYLINDYRVFLSDKNHQEPFEQVETLFRKYGTDLNRNDRWAIQEVLYLAECEAFLEDELNKPKRIFDFKKSGNFFKGHGMQAAAALREHLGYQQSQITGDVFSDIRKIGIHIFRRKLDNSKISGVYIKHPTVGKCILINYDEDIYRQRFTAAHELGHSILDLDDFHEVSITKNDDKLDKLVEIRVNTFASHYLVPPYLLKRIPDNRSWVEDKIRNYANYFNVNPAVLTFALGEAGFIDKQSVTQYEKIKILKVNKRDSEFIGVSENGRERRKTLLEKGISDYFIRLCFDSRNAGIISAARMAEMLLIDQTEIKEIYSTFGEKYHVE